MKIIYAGTPEFALPALQALIESDHEVVAVYTQPDRPAGRGRKLQPGPIKVNALRFAIPVLQPENFKDPDQVKQLQSFSADLMVVAAYGILLPRAILDAPRLGCINIHASLLPRWRGAAPIQRAILAGDSESGITLMQMDAGLDTGKMLAQERVPIDHNTTAASLHDELKECGARLLMNSLDAIEKRTIQAVPQNNAHASYAPKLSKQEALINWSSAAVDIHKEIRAFNPWPVSFSYCGGQSVKLWSADCSNLDCSGLPGQVIQHTPQGIYVCCGKGVLMVTEIQFAGKKRTTAGQLLNGRNLLHEKFSDA